MKKFMKKLAKKTEGFTLVELIVVIAILGILAGIAVPAYSGYLNKANEAADTTALSAIKTAALASQAKVGSVDKIVVTTDSGTIVKVEAQVNDAVNGDGDPDYTVLYDANATGSNPKWPNADFDTFLDGIPGPLKSDKFKGGAAWDGSDWDKATSTT